MRLTDQQLAEIAARANAAEDVDAQAVADLGAWMLRAVVQNKERGDPSAATQWERRARALRNLGTRAASGADVPALLAEVKRDREDAARWRAISPLLASRLCSRHVLSIDAPRMFLALGETMLPTDMIGGRQDVLVNAAVDSLRSLPTTTAPAVEAR